MKKIFALLLALTMVLSFAACGGNQPNETTAPAGTTTPAGTTAPAETTVPATTVPETTAAPAVTVMTYAEYAAAAIDDAVVVEFYVQATQSWWADKIVIYGQDKDGGYLAYNVVCSEEDAAKLVPGTKIRVTGFKTEWSGEIEIAEGATFEFVEGADTFIAEPMDATALLGTDELITHQNKLVSFKGLTVKSVSYKNDEPGDDIYLTLTLNGADYEFCVERYLTDPETEVYKTVGTLEAGDVVDVEGFLYWYNGSNPHITKITVAE